MELIEGILYMIWRGIAIGFIISAPMGPVGILCVQRTLDKGRKTGLYTGIGAAISDLIYCLITGFGLSFIEDFLEENQSIIQIVGSLVLIIFGVYLFRSNPAKSLRKPGQEGGTRGKDILSGFLFTFSNPLIIFLIIGLFARFNFMGADLMWYHYVVGFLSIITGALMWWYIITFSVDKVRAHFNLRSLWLVNKISGSIIIIFGIVGACTGTYNIARADNVTPIYLNSTRGFGRSDTPKGEPLHIKATGRDTIEFGFPTAGKSLRQLEMRVAELRREPSPGGWGIYIDTSSGERVTWSIERRNDRYDEMTKPTVEVKTTARGETPGSTITGSGLDLYGGYNSYRVQRTEEGFEMSAGDREYNTLSNVTSADGVINGVGVWVAPGGEIEVDNIVLRPAERPGRGRYEDIEALMDRLNKSTDPIEGIWVELDRTLDESMLRPGGDYRLAIISAGEGYDIVYLSGAAKRPGSWREGDVKGHLTPNRVKGVYRVEWVDSEGETLPGEIRAQYEGTKILDIQLPYLGSGLRLKKI